MAVPAASRSLGGVPSGSPERPFPYAIVSILALSYGVLNYTLANLFPYVGFMTQHLLQLSDKNQVGFYAGFIASSFTFGRFLTSYAWGYAVDALGRKPVMIMGLLSMVFFSVAFGVSPTLSWAISSRFLLGITNGMVSGIRAAVREVCGPEHVVIGMTYMSGATGVSVVFGAAIGGLLAQPAVYYPKVFSSTGLFATYPYLLPNLVGACLALVCLPLVIFFVPETKDFGNERSVELEAERRSTHHRNNGKEAFQRIDENGDDLVPGNNASQDTAGVTNGGQTGVDSATGIGSARDVRLWGPDGLLATPYVKLFLFLGAVTKCVRIGYQEAYPLWALSTEDVGGLDWGTKRIGEVLGLSGLLMTAGNLFVAPPLIRLFGLANWNLIGCLVTLAAGVAVPSVTSLSWDDTSLFVMSVVIDTILFFSQGAIMIALTVGTTSVVPSHKRGKLSGLFNAAESFGRCIGPAAYAMMYAWSVSSNEDWVDYHFIFYLSVAIMSVVTVLSWRYLTSDILTKPAEERGSEGGASCAAQGHDSQNGGDSSFVSSPRVGRRETDLV